MEKIKIDIICPIFYIDLNIFKKCIDSWYKNIPINRLIIGLGKESPELESMLYELDYPNLYIINQYAHKTLGYCIRELIECVDTKFFVYLHCDVELINNWFEKMWKKKVLGILESLKDPESFGKTAISQSEKYRAYSGAQLIYKKTVEDLDWEDDYIYTSEDIILQNIVENHKFLYTKVPIYHKHYQITAKRTQSKKTILDWQWKAIIKYTYPNKYLSSTINGLVKNIKKTYNIDIDWKKFAKENNTKWDGYHI